MDDIYPEFTRLAFDRPTVIDGEIVALGDDGVPSFSLLQQRMNVRGAKAQTLVEQVPLTLMAFDLLHHGTPLVDEPIEDRWDRLIEVVPSNMVRSPATREHGEAVFAAVVERGLEGMVAKKAGSRYRPGVRSEEWRKIVHRTSARFVVGGYLPGQRGRSSTFASLMLGLWDDGVLRFVGSAGSGFDDHALRHIRAALERDGESDVTLRPGPDDPAAGQVGGTDVGRRGGVPRVDTRPSPSRPCLQGFCHRPGGADHLGVRRTGLLSRISSPPSPCRPWWPRPKP